MNGRARGLSSGVLTRRPNGHLRQTLVPLAVVACLSLTACQDDSEPAASPQTSAASSPSQDSPTSSGDPSDSPSASASASPGAGPALDARAEEFLDRMSRGMGTKGTAHMEMTLSGKARSTSVGDMAYDGRGSQLRLVTRNAALGSGAVEIVVVRDAAYLSLPGLTAAGKFIRVDAKDPRFQQLAGSSIQMSPAQSVKAFRAGLISVEDRGRDTVQGTPTTAYDVKVDTVRALQAQGSDAVPGMPSTMTYRVWLDREDRMRRMALAIQGVRLSIELSKWGEPVDITAPPKSALVDAPPGF